MSSKKERSLVAIVILLAVLLLAALAGCGYFYNKIDGFEKQKKEEIATSIRDCNTDLATAKSNLEMANKKIKEFKENEVAYLKEIATLKDGAQKGQHPATATQSASVKTVKSAQATTSAKKPVTIKTVHKHKIKKMKSSQVKKIVHGKKQKHATVNKKNIQGKKHAHAGKKHGHVKKQYKQTAKRHHKKLGKVHATTKAVSLATLCEGSGSDAPFFQQLSKDAMTYGYTVKAWEEKRGSVKRLQILLTGPEMPNAQ